MPEGDTIHYAANRIRPVLVGHTPDRILAPQARHAAQRWPQQLAGLPVRAVDAHGKHLFLRFAGGLTLHSHLRMNGAWEVYESGRRWRRSPSRAWLILAVDGTQVVQFDGPVLELRNDAQLRVDRRLTSLGQDVIGESLDEERMLSRLRAGDMHRSIGDALLDQHVIAGIGNEWKSEACFAAGVDPWRPVAEVGPQQILEMVRFARAGMTRCAHEGYRARPKSVYGRRGLPCPRCGEPLRARGQGDQNRVTFWCASCQS